MSELYIGLMSGTSMDAIDAALVRFGEASLEILQTHEHEYTLAVRQQLSRALHKRGIRAVEDIGTLHVAIGECFRDATNVLLSEAGLESSAVTAIGSHGQTIRHEPNAKPPFSLQAGDPAIIAAGTGITTIADFRSADIALGGQGAPLAPAFHEWLLRVPGRDRIVLNIGGIANLTILPAHDEETTGFDTGPGNTLLDAWTRRHRNLPYDTNGSWSASGRVNQQLLQRLLADPYFLARPPKSTGFEYFNLDWLQRAGTTDIAPEHVQATLCELAAVSIANAVCSASKTSCEVLVCGGGVHNAELMRRLRARLPDHLVTTTSSVGLDPDWVEAAAFAWLAMRRLEELPGNLPAVTGAQRRTLLGSIYSTS